MFEFLGKLFNTDAFPARWHCGQWSAGHGWLHILSDIAVFGAYTAIPLTLAVVAWKKHQDIMYSKIVWLFGVFIFACGFGHLIEAIIFWNPVYRFAGVVKLFTALVSWATVIAIVRVLPQALTLPGLPKVNRMLEESLKEQRRMTQELDINRKRFQALVDNIPGVVFQLRKDVEEKMTFAYTSKGIDRLFSCSPEALQEDASGVLALLEASPKGGFREALERSEERLEPLSWEGRYVTADERERWVHVQAQPRAGNDAEILWDGVFVDTTELNHAREALSESQARNTAILHGTSDAFVTADAEGHILDCNRATGEMFGLEPGKVVEGTLLDLGVRQDVLQGMEEGEAAPGSISHKFESRYERQDGESLDLEVSVVPLDIEGRQQFSWHMRDITEQKQNELALRQKTEEAERANKAKSEFLSRMSHELRTPLNAILGFSQLLQRRKLSERDADSVNLIHKAGGHLLDLINEVLDLARIESGKFVCSIEPVEATLVIDEVVNFTRNAAEEKGLRLDVSRPDDIHVRADRQRLKQILLNLVSNAIKYNKPGGEVWVNCEIEGDEVLFQVRDSGKGISKKNMKKLFNPFERLGEETGCEEGTGIGLALSQSLAMLMGSEIKVESEEGQGSEFSLRLQRITEVHNEILKKRVGEVARQRSAGVERTVLYVEDNSVNLRLMEDIIAEFPSWKLMSATNGEDGLRMALESKPDLILLDLHLPDEDGDKVLKKVRMNPEISETKVVMVSANAMRDQVEKLLNQGADDYITKPVEFDRIMKLLESFDEPDSSALPS